MREDPAVELSLTLEEARALHMLLEDMLESAEQDPHIQHVYRLLSWRLLAASGGTGLSGRLVGLAREANTLEEYENARNRALGPVLDGLERGENRDP